MPFTPSIDRGGMPLTSSPKENMDVKVGPSKDIGHYPRSEEEVDGTLNTAPTVGETSQEDGSPLFLKVELPEHLPSSSSTTSLVC